MYRFVCARRVQTLSELARLSPTHRPQPSPDCLNCKFTTFTCKNIIFLEKFFHPSPKFSSPPSSRPDSLPPPLLGLSSVGRCPPPPLRLSSGGRRPLLPSPQPLLRLSPGGRRPLPPPPQLLRLSPGGRRPLLPSPRRSCVCLRVVAALCCPPPPLLRLSSGGRRPLLPPPPPLRLSPGGRLSRRQPFWRWGKL